MSLYRTLIIDDEVAARQVIRALLATTPNVSIVDEAANGTEAVAKILQYRPDLIFLDIQMPRLDGFGVLRQIWADHQPIVVFTTAYDQYALQAFEVNAIDYLLKPFDDIRFQQAMSRALSRLQSRNQPNIEQMMAQLIQEQFPGPKREYLQRILVKENGRMFFVNLNEVSYFDADSNYITLHTSTGNYIIYDSLTNLETRLNPVNFTRIHRSYIVNLAFIREIETHFNGDHIVKLESGESLKWTRSYRDNLRAFISRNE
ncbi:LytR/AlgR family response regulator transcription factor [Tellurirhabdus bombi]|uniref:LytR/AlgR family response regulator transcription factor n=1 Tax=Tellurirhabdus bombi TaxID=2907205 RepID=UPI001F45593B|nr:LytTR family DNA-binding domain-containing protein [Tellurirhabdus bombi]